MRNEARSIENCAASLMAQEYPPERLELLFYDGRSDDGTAELVRRQIAGVSNAVVLDNPKRWAAAAWNAGIARARGEYIGIVSGHVTLDRRYVQEAVRLSQETGAAMVGGTVRATGVGLVGAAIAAAMSHPFGVGSASFRYTDREEWVDTVFMGVCRSEIYRRFGFDESLYRNQDDELSYRLLDAGLTILCSPSIVSSYTVRSSYSALARQYFQYGYWKYRVITLHPRQVRGRHLVPSVTVTMAGLLVLASPFRRTARRILVAAVTTYGLAAAASAHSLKRRYSGARVPLVMIAFATIHGAYGVGFLIGAARCYYAGSLRGLIRRTRRAAR